VNQKGGDGVDRLRARVWALGEFAMSTCPTGIAGGSGGGGKARQQWCHRLGCGEQPEGRICDRGPGATNATLEEGGDANGSPTARTAVPGRLEKASFSRKHARCITKPKVEKL
jgi:hypothetical protein